MKYRLRKQLNIILIIAFLIISLIYGLILYPFEKQRHRTVIQKVELFLDTIAAQGMSSIGNEIFMDNTKGLKLTLSRLAAYEGILTIGAFDKSGRFLAASDERKLDDLSDPESDPGQNSYTVLESEFEEKDVLIYTVPIVVIGENYGYVRIVYLLEDVLRQSVFSVLFFVALLLTILWALTLIIHFSLIRLVTQPLTLLAAAMEKVKSGKLGVQVNVSTNNEIGGIAEVFNTMSQEQLEMHRKLDEANISLEKKVLERTEELREKNISLNRALAEIKTLRGFIPICSKCKKIRDDSGFWNQIEGYIQKHSEATFSHSVCPDCMRELYPEFADKILEGQE